MIMESENIIMVSIVVIVAIVAIFVYALSNTSQTQLSAPRTTSIVDGGSNEQPIDYSCIGGCLRIRNTCEGGELNCYDEYGNSIPCRCTQYFCECVEGCFNVNLNCDATSNLR